MKEVLSLLGALVGIMLVLAFTYFSTKWLSTKVNMSGVANSKYMKIMDKLIVGQNKSIVIIDVQGKYYLVGITEDKVELLKEIDSLELLTEEYSKEEVNFNKILTKFKRTY